ncbi:hypothetical protein [Sphingomonas flavalba]|uniref:hypothetical protein n=1 Tax=Sphingomonas flavalba TaxID=2559804 RepID=UPI00109D8B12|nr:hypothetical protein [Sphingomonas flavalba]
MRSKIRSFVNRVKRGEVVKPLYLTYYYAYLSIFDWKHKTRFSNSQAPENMGSPVSGGTGNFPVHPRLIRRFLRASGLGFDDSIVDVGHGSGIVLYTAAQMGYRNLTGIEYGRIPFEISLINVGNRATLIHGNALSMDLSPFKAISFFSPFRGDMACRFFDNLPNNITVVLTINHDRIIEPLLVRQGFARIYDYQHRIYENFNARIWRRGEPAV